MVTRTVNLKGLEMLVLTRRNDEAIVINDEIVVRVIDVRGDKVRLGVEAPSTVPIHRGEVHKAIQAERARANSGVAKGGE